MLTAFALLAAPLTVRADGPEIRVTGGGIAEFLDPNPCQDFNTAPPFGESFFTVAAKVEGSDVEGIFLCGVEDCFLGVDDSGDPLLGDILIVGFFDELLDASAAGQDSVALAGDALFFIEGLHGVQDEFEFTVTLREGGRGVGGFTYTDYVTELGAGIEYGDGLVDDGSDHELITRGRIRIRFDD